MFWVLVGYLYTHSLPYIYMPGVDNLPIPEKFGPDRGCVWTGLISLYSLSSFFPNIIQWIIPEMRDSFLRF